MPTWINGGTWTMSLLSWTAFATMYKEDKDCNPMYFYFENNRSTYYQTKEEFERTKQEIIKKVQQNPKYLKNKLAQIKNNLRKGKQLLEEINEKLKNNNNLADLFKIYWNLFSETIFGQAIDLYFDEIEAEELSEMLKIRLKEIGKDEKFTEYYTLLTAPLKLTITQKEEIEFLKILLQEENLLEQHREKYAHIPAWFDNISWRVGDFKKRATNFKNKEEIQKRLNILENEIQRRKKAFQEFIKEVNPTEDMLNKIALIQEFSYLRQEGEVQIGYHNHKGIPLKSKICEQLGITMNDLKFLTPKEIIRNLKDEDPSLMDMINERKKFCFMIMQDGEYNVYTGEEATSRLNKIKKEIIQEEKQSNQIIKGLVGSTGFAKGNVCIINSLEDINKIKQGEIMVVSGTSVEYLPAMQKSAGIIAEYGGITSHAAIIARELKIPCITKVKDATKLLKDGELIELDAFKGEIRK